MAFIQSQDPLVFCFVKTLQPISIHSLSPLLSLSAYSIIGIIFLSLSTEKLNRFWCSYLNTSILSHSYSHWYTTYHIKHIGTLPTYIKHIGTLPTYIKHKGTLPTYIKHIGTLCMFTYQQVHIYIHIVTLPTYSFIWHIHIGILPTYIYIHTYRYTAYLNIHKYK